MKQYKTCRGEMIFEGEITDYSRPIFIKGVCEGYALQRVSFEASSLEEAEQVKNKMQRDNYDKFYNKL